MRVRTLPLALYVAKFHEQPKTGRRYEIDDGVIYRVNGAEAEDIGELPEDLTSAVLEPTDFPGGAYVGDPEAIARLRSLGRSIRALVGEVESVLRT